ncbi:MAG: RNA polymerase sigma factor [Symploca sp. SIO2E6]|nr:RNA polymerase sigma factor [Symploca sp. SIO2E6]
MSNSQSVTASFEWSCSGNLGKEFWRQWEQYQDYLYHCCLKWMKGNSTDAEDALSRAMLKAWEKVQKFAGKIANFKSWLTTLTRNLCVDIHRERSRGASGVENIEWVTDQTETMAIALVETPELVLEKDEKDHEIRQAIADLPQILQHTFMLHFYQERTYKEIAQEQGISYDNVAKRISQARKILKQQLRGYFLGEERETTRKEAALRSRESTPPNLGKEPRQQEVDTHSIITPECIETIRVEASVETPQTVLNSSKRKEQQDEDIDTEEKVTEIGGEADLPETFVIYFYQELLRSALPPQLNKRNNIFPYSLIYRERSHIKVVQDPGISYDNLRQWLSRAKSIFRGVLKKIQKLSVENVLKMWGNLGTLKDWVLEYLPDPRTIDRLILRSRSRLTIESNRKLNLERRTYVLF